MRVNDSDLDLSAADRHIVRVALGIHVEALLKEAKKLEQLGHQGLAEKLNLEAQTIIENIRPCFDEQQHLAFG